MAFSTKIKLAANRILSLADLRLETRLAQQREAARIEALDLRGYFDKPAFPILEGMRRLSLAAMIEAYQRFGDDLGRLMSGKVEPTHFDPTNGFYRSPDAEILYLMVRALAPRRCLEIGSGNSTKIIRQAILDGGLRVEHTAVDPEPRIDIYGLVDRVNLLRLEDIDIADVVGSLGPDDFLFIDSSHEARPGNDVARLFCSIIPALAPGVVVHVHDIFLPFDYPRFIATLYPYWGEQYLLQALLDARPHQIIWPGYYVQKLRPDACGSLPFLQDGLAQSFWFKVGSEQLIAAGS